LKKLKFINKLLLVLLLFSFSIIWLSFSSLDVSRRNHFLIDYKDGHIVLRANYTGEYFLKRIDPLKYLDLEYNGKVAPRIGFDDSMEIQIDSNHLRKGNPNEVKRNIPVVVFAGGSETFGWRVPFEETFVKKFENLMQNRVQTINCGVPLAGTITSIGYLERNCLKFEPSLVVLQISVGQAPFMFGDSLLSDFQGEYAPIWNQSLYHNKDLEWNLKDEDVSRFNYFVHWTPSKSELDEKAVAQLLNSKLPFYHSSAFIRGLENVLLYEALPHPNLSRNRRLVAEIVESKEYYDYIKSDPDKFLSYVFIKKLSESLTKKNSNLVVLFTYNRFFFDGTSEQKNRQDVIWLQALLKQMNIPYVDTRVALEARDKFLQNSFTLNSQGHMLLAQVLFAILNSKIAPGR